ncbi:hypothetical protein R3P38DRAFT_2820160 [Favolaschia claudopus]|uniref:F-box domain-containing protein n=1 Tax=Favolaschia claudopus TaxID=2862362 RepID=A0AAW0EGS4_9AGAR
MKVKRVVETTSRFLRDLWTHRRPRQSIQDGIVSPEQLKFSLNINSLPPEILVGEIFPLVIDDVDAKLWLKSILVLECVCPNWRRLVQSAPLLWTGCISVNTLQFQAKRHSNRLVKKYLAHIERALSRSSPLAVPVSLDWKEFRNLKDFTRAVDLIFHVSSRWKSLRISTGSNYEAAPCALHALRSIPPDSLQSLTALTLTIPPNITPAIYPHSPLAFQTAPNLRNVRLFVWWAENIDVIPMPWAQLTHLSLTSCVPRACIETLVQCPNVVSAFLGCPYPQLDTLAVLGGTSSLEHLETLRISASPAFIEGLGDLTFPALGTLELFYPDDDGMVWSSPDKFQRFPLVSAPNLQHLKLDLHGETLSSLDLCALLRCTPTISHLDLTGCISFDNDLLSALRADTERDTGAWGSSILIPRLEVLSVDCETEVGVDFDEAKMRQMVISRHQPDPGRGLSWFKALFYKGVGRTFGENLGIPDSINSVHVRSFDVGEHGSLLLFL